MKVKPIAPIVKFKKLSPKSRQTIIKIVRGYILEFDIHNENHMGLEATEEMLISLIDKGVVRISVDKCGVYWLEEYSPELEKFLPLIDLA